MSTGDQNFYISIFRVPLIAQFSSILYLLLLYYVNASCASFNCGSFFRERLALYDQSFEPSSIDKTFGLRGKGKLDV